MLGGVRMRTEKQSPPAESRLGYPWFPTRPWRKGGEKESLLLQTVQEFLIASPQGLHLQILDSGRSWFRAKGPGVQCLHCTDVRTVVHRGK